MADLYDIADRLQPTVRKAFLEAIDSAKRSTRLSPIEAALRTGDAGRVVTLITDELPSTLRRFMKPLRDALDEVLGKTGVSLAAVLGLSFDLFNPLVLDAVDRRVLNLVDTVAADAETSVRSVVSRGWVEGITVPEQARMVRSVIGLTNGHATAVQRYFESMVGTVPMSLAERNRDTYARRLLNWRANVIAHTENITAANAGQYLLWRDMADKRILQVGRTWLEWDVTLDDRLCKFCAPMDGKRVRLNQPFESTEVGFPNGAPDPPKQRQLRPDPLGQSRDHLGRFAKSALRERVPPVVKLHPPLHPQCRCGLVLRFE